MRVVGVMGNVGNGVMGATFRQFRVAGARPIWKPRFSPEISRQKKGPIYGPFCPKPAPFLAFAAQWPFFAVVRVAMGVMGNAGHWGNG